MPQILTQAPETPDVPGPKATAQKKKEDEQKAKAERMTGNRSVTADLDMQQAALNLEKKKAAAEVAAEEDAIQTSTTQKSDATSAEQMNPAAQVEQPPTEMDSKQILMQMLSGGQQSEREAALLQQMADVQGQQAERHQGRFEADQALYERELAKPASTNLMPLMRALDGITGKNLSQFYTQPKTQEQKDEQLFGLRDIIGKNQDKMSGTQLSQLQTLLKVKETDNESNKLKLLYNDAVRREKSADTKADRDHARNEAMEYKKSKFGVDLVNKIEKDSSVKESTKVLDEASNLRSIVEIGGKNPIAAASIPTFMARVAGEVGNLSEADKRPFGGSRAITERFEASLKQWSEGTLTEDNKAFLVEFIDVLDRKRGYLLSKRKRALVDQYSKGQTMFTKDQLYGIAGVEPAAVSDGPSIGTIQDGYKYIGGDPGNQTSWEQVK